jgi:hypothetical protein
MALDAYMSAPDLSTRGDALVAVHTFAVTVALDLVARDLVAAVVRGIGVRHGSPSSTSPSRTSPAPRRRPAGHRGVGPAGPPEYRPAR